MCSRHLYNYDDKCATFSATNNQLLLKNAYCYHWNYCGLEYILTISRYWGKYGCLFLKKHFITLTKHYNYELKTIQ